MLEPIKLAYAISLLLLISGCQFFSLRTQPLVA